MLTDEQREARRSAVGASEVASVVGLSNRPAPIDVLQSKLGVDTFNGNEWTELGDALEEPVAKLWARRAGVKIRRHARVIHPRFTHVAASPDFVARIDGAIENVQIKTAGRWAASEFGEELTDEVPRDYWTQTQVEMACLGVVATRLVALVAGELREYRVTLDKELTEHLCERADAWFRRHVIAREPIEPDGSKAFDGFIAAKFPKESGEVIAAPADIEVEFAEWRRVKTQIKELETHADAAEQRVRLAIGSASEMVGSGWAVTLKEQTRKTVDYKALVASLGVEESKVAEFTKQSAFRALRVKGVK